MMTPLSDEEGLRTAHAFLLTRHQADQDTIAKLRMLLRSRGLSDTDIDIRTVDHAPDPPDRREL